MTSDDLVRRVLHAIDASQSDAQRVPGGADRLRRSPRPPRPTGAAPPGTTAPLLGVPIAVKDDVDVAGVPTAFGTDGPCPRPPTADAEVVRRLRAAGAVIVGKTNTCEFGQWPFTSGPGFGHTRNPWARNHTPGGSSGGSAAAVAAGLVAAAIGSDGAGSVRIPAAWTNLVGIKPQRGRISTWPLPEAFNGITVYGVLARTVADAALVLDAVAGNVAGDLHQPPPVSLSESVGMRAGRAAHRDVDAVPLHGVPRPACIREIRAALGTVAEQLARLGHTVMDGNPDYGLRLSWSFLPRSTSGLVDWADRIGSGVAPGRAHPGEHADGPAAVPAGAAPGPRARGGSAAARVGCDLRRRRRRAGADHRAAAAERATGSTTSAAPPPTAR